MHECFIDGYFSTGRTAEILFKSPIEKGTLLMTCFEGVFSESEKGMAEDKGYKMLL